MRTALWIGTLLLCFATPTPAARPKPGAPSTPEQREAAWQQHQRMEAESDFRGLRWRSIGPTGQGGRVVDFASVPGQPYTFYVAYASGGVWKTTNNGGSFEPL
ncbi:MAG: glycosyl hydrolase, partial [Aquimonas sp.]|nr:glycosyl hydrolase [Aquimonas sp.]